MWEGNKDEICDDQDEEPKPQTDGDQEDSKDEKGPKSPTDEEQNDRRDEDESKPATNEEQGGPRDEEITKPSTEEGEDESRNEAEPKPSTDGEHGSSRFEEEAKNPTNGEQDVKTNDEIETPADVEQNEKEPNSLTDEEDDSPDEKESELSADEEDDSKAEEEPESPTDEEEDKSRNEEEAKSPKDGQEEAYKVVLRQHQATIEAEMSPKKVIPRLEQEGFVDDEEARELLLMAPENLPEVNRNILTVVTREGEDAFVVLRDVMEETGQNQILELIQHVEVETPPDDSAERVKRKLRDAMKARNSKRLRNAIAEYKELGLSPKEPIYKEAKKRLEVLEKLLTHRHAILKMESKTVSEIRGYNRPPAAVQQVMTATFLLLGNSKKETKGWKSLQALMGKTGKESLKQRVKKFEPNDVPLNKVAQARRGAKGLEQRGRPWRQCGGGNILRMGDRNDC
ncbi:uncharacterized protein [Branchiostoma lanceolatum]|uniref:uncharacterized protein n=1 Tax=Branchiostoma lanceolatum TaxID=7740 RepID=UPI0034528675